MRALTGSERRLVSVVMASLPPDQVSEANENLEESAPASSFETMAASFDPRSIVASFGASAEMLADGSIVVTLSGKGARERSGRSRGALRALPSLASHRRARRARHRARHRDGAQLRR